MGDEPIAARVSLRGLPVDQVLDAAGHIVVTGGLDNVAAGSYVLLEGGGEGIDQDAIAGFAWTLEAPEGSGASLDNPASMTPIFVPDVTGYYTAELTVANQAGISGTPGSMIIHVATWVGVGIVDAVDARPPQCIACHADRVETWAGTLHATSFTRFIDGTSSEYFRSQCVGCHTVGYDDAAVNGGFDDVATELGWSFPQSLLKGNWETLVASYPRLANLANVQCENCHGPGGGHDGSGEGIAVSLSTSVCAACHDPFRQGRVAQWDLSGHAHAASQSPVAGSGLSGGEGCRACHSGWGFIERVSGKQARPGPVQSVTCPVCHDPHEAVNEHQLRVYDGLVLRDGTEVTGVGPSALCMTCHNGGVDAAQVHEEDPILPHGSTAAEMIVGTGGYDYGEVIEDSAHSSTIKGCVSCHMASTPGMDDMGTADDIGDDVPLPGHNLVGEHTFRVTWDGGTPDDPADDLENVAACGGCHRELSHFNRKAAGDYDGDGERGGIQDEVRGLLDLVGAEIRAQGVLWPGDHADWGTSASEAQKAAIYNWRFVARDGSMGIHNAGRAVRLLQLTYRDLTGRDVPGATMR